jgi:hypothetical protein
MALLLVALASGLASVWRLVVEWWVVALHRHRLRIPRLHLAQRWLQVSLG